MIEKAPVSTQTEHQTDDGHTREHAYTDLDEEKSLAEIDAARVEADRLQARREYEERRDKMQRGYRAGEVNSTIVPRSPTSWEAGDHSTSHTERNRIEMRVEGIANANHPQDDASLRY